MNRHSLVKVIVMGVLIMVGSVTMLNAQTTRLATPLNDKQQSIVAISALTARGNLEQLKVSLTTGLDSGLTINEAKEVLIHLYAYTGFPRSLNGINTLMAVVEERQRLGVNDVVGEEAKAVRTDKSKYEIGKENLALLSGVQPSANPVGYAAFVPTIEVFLKEHLFADIFERGVLDYQTRELVTVSALSSMDGVNSQLRSHLNLALYNGLSEAQLQNMLAIVAAKVGKQQSDNANAVLKQLLEEKKEMPKR